MIERLGHSKRLQTIRREWIEEEKPQISTDIQAGSPQINLPADTQTDHTALASENRNTTSAKLQENLSNYVIPDGVQNSVDDTNLPALAEADERLFMSDDDFARLPDDQGAPDDDEWDALLREQEDLVFINTST